ncbi:hypothetical protein C2S51_016757 [Perilla frutescens var. frutescens]|nr:hypothetical protein C2S51_016757 [Perilla frutescens var. frutescens]
MNPKSGERAAWTPEEINVLKKVLYDYSRGALPHIGKDYYDVATWEKLCALYNERARMNRLDDQRTYGDIVEGGRRLESTFYSEEGVFMTKGVRDEFCEECRRRIPVFPTTLLPDSPVNSGNGCLGANRAAAASCGANSMGLAVVDVCASMLSQNLITDQQMVSFLDGFHDWQLEPWSNFLAGSSAPLDVKARVLIAKLQSSNN